MPREIPTNGRKGRSHKLPPHSNRLGRLLRSRRLELGLTLAVVAKRAMMTTGNVASYEGGYGIPGPGRLGRLASALHLDPDKLWRTRRSTLIGLDFDRAIHQLQLSKRAAMATAERGLEDQDDVRARRLESVVIP